MLKFGDFKTMPIYSADLSRWPVHLVKPALATVVSRSRRAPADAALRTDAALRHYAPAQGNLKRHVTERSTWHRNPP